MLKSILLIAYIYIMVDLVLLSQYSRNVKCIIICYILERLHTLFYYHIRNIYVLQLKYRKYIKNENFTSNSYIDSRCCTCTFSSFII